MKILLVSPSQAEIRKNISTSDFPPLGLGYVAAALERAGYAVEIMDIDADKITEENFIRTIKRKNFNLIGFNTTTPTFNNAVRLSELVKENSDTFTVVGGVHASAMPEETMKFASIDFLVKGEGEATIIELVRALEGSIEIESVDGLYYRKNGRTVNNKDRQLISNLDEVAFPARHLYKSRNYNYPDSLSAPVFPIITSRGCPAYCTFCAASCIFKHRFRMRSPKNIADEIQLLISKYKAKEIHIWDDNFVFVKSRVFGIRDELKRRNIKIRIAIPDGVRIDCVDREVLSALKNMGTYSIAYGVESGSQRILDNVNKNIRLEQVEKVIKMTREAGIEIWAFFILGLPGENEESIKNTIDFAKKINPDIAKFHILKPFPGTKIFDELRAKNLVRDLNFSNYGLYSPPVHDLEELTAEEICRWHNLAYRQFYFRPHIILKQALRLKSLHRLRLNLTAAATIVRHVLQK